MQKPSENCGTITKIPNKYVAKKQNGNWAVVEIATEVAVELCKTEHYAKNLTREFNKWNRERNGQCQQQEVVSQIPRDKNS